MLLRTYRIGRRALSAVGWLLTRRGPHRRLERKAWWHLLAVELELSLNPDSTLREAAVSADSCVSPSAAENARRIGESYRQAAQNHFWPMYCLTRSMALQRSLRKQGIGADLCIGMVRSGSRIDGHAWVEVDGTIIGDDAAVRSKFPLTIRPETMSTLTHLRGNRWAYNAQ
jgi:hypothetical protein